MGLTSETNRIVEQFEYDNAGLNQGVREFISQMGMSPSPCIAMRCWN